MQKNADLISIIIPVYKVEKYLDRCLESVLNQNYKNTEVILVDDGSPDNCPKMCDDWAKKDKRIKVIHKQNGGVSSARNEGLKIAKGEYVCFVDSDDEVLPNYCEDLLKALKDNDADMAIGTMINVHGEVRKIIKQPKKQLLINPKNKKDVLKMHKNSHYVNPINKIYKKEKIKELFNIDYNYGEDLIFNFYYIKNCEKIVIIKQPIYLYHVIQGSLSLHGDINVYKKILKLYDIRYQLIFDIVKDKKYAGYIAGEQFFNVVYYNILGMYRNQVKYEEIEKVFNEICENPKTKDIIKNYWAKTIRTKIIYNSVKNKNLKKLLFWGTLKGKINKIIGKK